MKITTTDALRQNSSFKPEAWIAIQRNRQKIYKGSKIYLEDGQEFQLELYNPTKSAYLAKILINGSPISSRGIILHPGQRVFLERFIDDNRKLLYSTYEVEDTEEVKEAISNNGKVSVQFFEESKFSINQFGTIHTGTTWGGSNGTWITNPGTFNYTGGTDYTNMFVGTNYKYSADNTSTVNQSFFSNTSTVNLSTENAGSLETGRVQKGENSDQSFEDGFGSFNAWASHTSNYQILPISQLPIEPSEMRNYCGNCGTRIRKSTWKFCPNCGENLE